MTNQRSAKTKHPVKQNNCIKAKAYVDRPFETVVDFVNIPGASYHPPSIYYISLRNKLSY